MKDYLQLFNDSYEVVLGGMTDKTPFFETFYAKFTAQSADIAEKFTGIDLEKQRRMLKKSLVYLINFFVNKRSSWYMDEIAQFHCSDQLDISQNLYDAWLDALIETLRERHPKFEDDIELSWRIVMAPGIAYMKFHYAKKQENPAGQKMAPG